MYVLSSLLLLSGSPICFHLFSICLLVSSFSPFSPFPLSRVFIFISLIYPPFTHTLHFPYFPKFYCLVLMYFLSPLFLLFTSFFPHFFFLLFLTLWQMLTWLTSLCSPYRYRLLGSGLWPTRISRCLHPCESLHGLDTEEHAWHLLLRQLTFLPPPPSTAHRCQRDVRQRSQTTRLPPHERTFNELAGKFGISSFPMLLPCFT